VRAIPRWTAEGWWRGGRHERAPGESAAAAEVSCYCDLQLAGSRMRARHGIERHPIHRDMIIPSIIGRAVTVPPLGLGAALIKVNTGQPGAPARAVAAATAELGRWIRDTAEWTWRNRSCMIQPVAQSRVGGRRIYPWPDRRRNALLSRRVHDRSTTGLSAPARGVRSRPLWPAESRMSVPGLRFDDARKRPAPRFIQLGVTFDPKRRRRHAALTSHGISSAARRARANAEARGGGLGGDDGRPAPGG
jgi:hypothetical protein